MACEVTSALAFLHSAPEPIIHMDLKPGKQEPWLTVRVAWAAPMSPAVYGPACVLSKRMILSQQAQASCTV
jgi:hypothetical protein